MKLRAVASLFLATSIVAAAGTASAQAADTSKVIGLRFETTLFQPFDVRGISTFGLTEVERPLPARADVFRPNGDIRIGYDLPFGLTPMVGFGLRSHSVKAYSDADGEELDEGVGRTDIVISAELRYYFSPHKRGLQPFVFGEANWNIASFGTEHPDGTSEDVEKNAEFRDERAGDVNSVTNINAGLGLEYKFARSFGVGAKWGFGVSLAPTSHARETIGGTTREEFPTTNTVWGTSSSIYLAFRL